MRRIGRGLRGVVMLAALIGCGGGSSSSATGGTGGGATPGGGNSGTGKAGATGSGGTNGTGGATGAFTTSVSSGTKLTALSGNQATQLCDDLDNYIDRAVVPVLCGTIRDLLGPKAAYNALLANPSSTDADVRATCVAELAEAGSCSNVDASVQNSCDASSFATVPATCTATVGDYATCIDAINPAYAQYGAAVPSCGTLTVASLRAYFAADGGGTLGPADPAACAIFGPYAACSGVVMPTTGSKE
jgi:hypothetical protein